MKQLNKIKCAIIAFAGGIAIFLILGVCLAIFSPFLAFNAAKKTYKNDDDIIEFDITINK